MEHLLHHSQTRNTHLLGCIEYAKLFHKGDLSISDLPTVNLSLERKLLSPNLGKQAQTEAQVTSKPEKSPCDSQFSQRNDSEWTCAKQKEPISDKMAQIESCLAAFLRGNETSDSGFSALLLPFLQADLTSPLLPRFYRHLKAFLASLPVSHKRTARLLQRALLTSKHRQLTHTLEQLVKPSTPNVYESHLQRQQLALSAPCPIPDPGPSLKDDDSTCSVELSLPEDLSEASESVTFPESEEFVADKDKRRHVCLTIYRILQSNGFNVKDAKSLALKIEGRMRRQDPGMTAGYAIQYKKMVKDIQRLQPEVLICS